MKRGNHKNSEMRPCLMNEPAMSVSVWLAAPSQRPVKTDGKAASPRSARTKSPIEVQTLENSIKFGKSPPVCHAKTYATANETSVKMPIK